MKWSIYDKDDEIFEEACQMADWMREEEQAKKQEMEQNSAPQETPTPRPQPKPEPVAKAEEGEKPRHRLPFLPILSFVASILFLTVAFAGITLWENTAVDYIALAICIILSGLFARWGVKGMRKK